MRKENFDDHGAEGERGQIVPGRSWAAWARALGHLLPPLVIADLGCGDGYLTIEASPLREEGDCRRSLGGRARRARRSSRRGTSAVARRAKVDALANIEWKRGELEKLPLEDASVDVALLSQALHHAAAPDKALAEAARIVKPGGRVLLLELRAPPGTLGPRSPRRHVARLRRRGAEAAHGRTPA